MVDLCIFLDIFKRASRQFFGLRDVVLNQNGRFTGIMASNEKEIVTNHELRWVRVTDRLPEKSGWYMIMRLPSNHADIEPERSLSWMDEFGVSIGWLNSNARVPGTKYPDSFPDSRFYDDHLGSRSEDVSREVIAWAPMIRVLDNDGILELVRSRRGNDIFSKYYQCRPKTPEGSIHIEIVIKSMNEASEKRAVASISEYHRMFLLSTDRRDDGDGFLTTLIEFRFKLPQFYENSWMVEGQYRSGEITREIRRSNSARIVSSKVECLDN